MSLLASGAFGGSQEPPNKKQKTGSLHYESAPPWLVDHAKAAARALLDARGGDPPTEPPLCEEEDEQVMQENPPLLPPPAEPPLCEEEDDSQAMQENPPPKPRPSRCSTGNPYTRQQSVHKQPYGQPNYATMEEIIQNEESSSSGLSQREYLVHAHQEVLAAQHARDRAAGRRLYGPGNEQDPAFWYHCTVPRGDPR